jgi:hypothetical protein
MQDCDPHPDGNMTCPNCGAHEFDLDYENNFLGDMRDWSCWECGHEWTEEIKDSENQPKSEGE